MKFLSFLLSSFSGKSSNIFERKLVLIIAVFQGIALVVFPSISTILTSSTHFGLTTTEFGFIFLPQVLFAIIAALLGSRLTSTLGGKRILLIGLASDAISMLFLLVSSLFFQQQDISLPLLMFSTAFMGFGFGCVVPILNTLTSIYHPGRVDQAILMLNALLGLGTVLAPAIAAFVVGAGFWWVLPLFVLLGVFLLFILSTQQHYIIPSQVLPGQLKTSVKKTKPFIFVVFIGLSVLYGVIETLNGNWSVLYMSSTVKSSPQISSLALTIFWSTVTLGRLFFGQLSTIFTPKFLILALPSFLISIFIGIGNLGDGQVYLALLLFGLAGLGCSALLPLIISFGQNRLLNLGPSVAGILIAAYQFGYGVASFGGGSIQQLFNFSVMQLFKFGSVACLAFLGLALFITLPNYIEDNPN